MGIVMIYPTNQQAIVRLDRAKRLHPGWFMKVAPIPELERTHPPASARAVASIADVKRYLLRFFTDLHPR